MKLKKHGRQYDIVVFGATGYTGKLLAEYITENLPTDLKWAVAGRSEAKLQLVVDENKKANPDRLPPAIEVTNLNDEELASLAKKACVLLSTVGPYAKYGEPAFKACAENGTHYVDVTGEMVWVERMIKKYEGAAKASGAILVPQAGIESAPPDLSTWAMAKTLRTELGLPTKDVKFCIYNLSSSPSGGTSASALGLLDEYSLAEIQAASQPYALSPVPHAEPSRVPSTLAEKIFGVRTIPSLGVLTTCPIASSDAAIVERTWGLLQETPSRKDQAYGPKFTFSEYLKTRNWLSGVFFHWALIIGFMAVSFISPLRQLLKRYVVQPGDGTKKEDAANEAIEYRGVAYPDSEKPSGKAAFCRTFYHGGIYYLTENMDDSHTTSASPNATASEATPLLPSTPTRPKGTRTVTFSDNPVTRTFEPIRQQLPARGPHHSSHHAASTSGSSGPPMLAALNNKLRRRHSQHGTVPAVTQLGVGPKLGPQRSTKKTEKLKLLPNPDIDAEEEDEESGRDVYSQYTRIKDPTARRDAARLGKADRDRLPRVTAYCTANRYEMDGLMRFFKGRGKSRGANPKLIDECIYTPYCYPKSVRGRLDPVQTYERRHSTGGEAMDGAHQRREDLIDLRGEDSERRNGLSGHNGHSGHSNTDNSHITNEDLLGHDNQSAIADNNPDFDTHIHTPEVFLFDYGVVVIWGMTEAQEAKFLKEIAKFETEKLAADDVEVELFNFYYTREYQARIYNDFITLRDKTNYMTKLAISHALAQSVKTSLFEELIASTVETCKDIPTQIALTGKIALRRSQINMQIGELFILRINIHLNGSVLDTPELFWVEPQLEPVYQAVRSYLEMDQRVGLLTERLDVIADLLAVLKGELSHGHDEKLEWIVIVLIAMEILVAAINIVVDLYVGE
ncbi:sporulation protein RMD1 [Mariannaea sp. PMI_226]|nr:sporulation protein RMD1 [Mariannaea sp. PMI_226]